MLHLKFKTFFLSSGMVLVADIMHTENKLITKIISKVILLAAEEYLLEVVR